MGHPGIDSPRRAGIGVVRVERNIAGYGCRSIGARQGEADQKLFQDDSGFERAASFEIEVGLEEPGWKLVHPAWSEVGMLSTGFFHGEGGHTGQPTRFVKVLTRGSE